MPERSKSLLAAARRARKRAYCPYSHYSVGAAVQADDGRMFTGCNIENASYGLTICAERAAIFKAITEGARRLIRVAVSCQKDDVENTGSRMPCGACRQVMREFMSDSAEIIVDGAGTFALAALLPRAFSLAPRPLENIPRRKK